MVERISQPPVFNFMMMSVLLEHPGRMRILLCATSFVLCDLGEGWEGLEWGGTTGQSKDGSSLCPHWSHQAVTMTGKAPVCPCSHRSSLGAAGTALTCSLCPAQRFPALHQGLGLSGFQAQSLKCGKAWKIGQRVRQGIVIFLKMLRELQCVSDCDSGDVKILRSLCPVHQDYH